MRISKDIERKHLPKHFIEYLSFITTFNIKSSVFILTFILLDIGLLPLLYPKIDIIYFITIPLLVWIHLWAIRLFFKNPYSVQLESVLYIGLVGAVGTLCYFILVLKMAYFNVGIRAPAFYIVFSVAYLLTVFILVLYQVKRYAVIEENKKKKGKNMAAYGTLIAVVPGSGYMFGQYLVDQSQVLMYSVMLFAYSFLSIFMAYMGAKFIYKYIMMKRNTHVLNYQLPPKKMRREFREKGIEIK